MADQFFSPSDKTDSSNVPHPNAKVEVKDAPATPTPPSTPPPLEPLSSPAEVTRSAQKKKRRLLIQLSVAFVVIVVLVIILIWRLSNNDTAPNTTNVVTNTKTNEVNTPTPTLNSQLPGSNSSSANTVGWQAITVDYVKNLTYPSSPIWSSTNGWKDVPDSFTLVNGVSYFEGGWYELESQKVTVHLTAFVKDEAIGTGDIDNDGLTDAVVIMKWTDGGTGAFPIMYTVFGSQPKTPVFNNDILAGVVGGSYSATKVEISHNTLRLQLSFPQAGDASCCWTGQANLTLNQDGQQWKLVD